MPLAALWFGSGHGPQNPPDPAYPDGKDIDGTQPGRPSCSITLDVPAPEVGYWLLQCDRCGLSVVVTAAGRPDDPRRLTVPCRPNA